MKPGATAMRASDRLLFAVHSLSSSGTRTLLMLLALSVGVASVVMLTALGEGARRYVQSEFTALGSHLLIVLPGRSETAGGAPPLMGETPRDLTLQDASALIRSASVGRVAPVVELPETGHHGMLDQPLVLTTAIRTLLADWDHSTPQRR